MTRSLAVAAMWSILGAEARGARADHRRGAEAELERGADGRGRGAILDRARRVRALELHEEALNAELRAEPWALEERRLAFTEGHAVSWVGDRQDGRVAPG